MISDLGNVSSPIFAGSLLQEEKKAGNRLNAASLISPDILFDI
jgi:hypothetical protein